MKRIPPSFEMVGMKGLPQPYNLNPKKTSWLTTPQKRLLFYALALFSIGFIIYSSIPPRDQPTEIIIDTEKISGGKLKRVGDGLDNVGDDTGAVVSRAVQKDSNNSPLL